jgi:hypothetical protein
VEKILFEVLIEHDLRVKQFLKEKDSFSDNELQVRIAYINGYYDALNAIYQLLGEKS